MELKHFPIDKHCGGFSHSGYLLIILSQWSSGAQGRGSHSDTLSCVYRLTRKEDERKKGIKVLLNRFLLLRGELWTLHYRKVL